MSENNNQALEKAAKQFEENLAKYPIEEQIAVGLISKNVLNGCSWEFTRPNNDLRRNLAEFKKSGTCSVQEVTYDLKSGKTGYLVYMKMPRLLSILSKEAPGLISKKDLDLAVKHREESFITLTKHLQKKGGGRIGIYCTNDSPAITVDGVTYPAFAVSLRELMQVCQTLGYGVVVAGSVRSPEDILKREDAVLKSLLVAPSSNALFIEVAKR